jgi:hypothetical protein
MSELLICDFCQVESLNVIMIRIQSSNGDLNEYNVCPKSWCKAETFGEIRRFLTEAFNPDYIKNERSYVFQIR